MIVKIKKIADTVKTPEFMSDGASGCDLTSIETYTLIQGERHLFSTGISMEIPYGWEGQIRSRSGLALKYGVMVFQGVGTVDSDYRGEIGVLLYNASSKEYKVKKGDRIAQIIFSKIEKDVIFEIVEQLSETGRGEGGWGSSGG